jgi:hypothetical protein
MRTGHGAGAQVPIRTTEGLSLESTCTDPDEEGEGALADDVMPKGMTQAADTRHVTHSRPSDRPQFSDSPGMETPLRAPSASSGSSA